jgi:glycosyltransferase involved in cell wall biosynthesis
VYLKEKEDAKIKMQIKEKPKKTKVDYSIIIPTFQEEKILERVLSLYTQELKSKYNFELIVSDGGSTDNTIKIAEKYADKVIVHTKEKKQTIGEGRNMGAEAADGDILVFINADTYPADFSQFFSAVERLKDTNGSEIAISCHCRAIPEEERMVDRIFYSIHNPILKIGTKLGFGYGRGECQVIKKQAFKTVGGYDATVHAGEDFDLYGRLTKIGKIKYDKDLLVYESTRRFRKYGYFRVLSLWAMNAIAVKVKGKSMSEDWEAVR